MFFFAGKTYTMEGGEDRSGSRGSVSSWQSDPDTGIIPQALCQIFDDLRSCADSEFSVRVSRNHGVLIQVMRFLSDFGAVFDFDSEDI